MAVAGFDRSPDHSGCGAPASHLTLIARLEGSQPVAFDVHETQHSARVDDRDDHLGARAPQGDQVARVIGDVSDHDSLPGRDSGAT